MDSQFDSDWGEHRGGCMSTFLYVLNLSRDIIRLYYLLADVVHGVTVALLLLNTDLHSNVSSDTVHGYASMVWTSYN